MAKVPDPTPPPVLLLCDWAQAINGKLYLQGAGIDRVVAGMPLPLAVGILLYIGWNETNEPLVVTLQLTRDGDPYPAGNPLEARWSLEIGRPPGSKHGSVFSAALALTIPAIQFEPGRYDLSVMMNDARGTSLTFEAVGGQLP